MKYVCEIEYPDDCGPNWMNKDNLLLCLNAYCKGVEFQVKDHICVLPESIQEALNSGDGSYHP